MASLMFFNFGRVGCKYHSGCSCEGVDEHAGVVVCVRIVALGRDVFFSSFRPSDGYHHRGSCSQDLESSASRARNGVTFVLRRICAIKLLVRAHDHFIFFRSRLAAWRSVHAK